MVVAKLSWEQTIQLVGAADWKYIVDILFETNKIRTAEDRMDYTKRSKTALKLTPEGSCRLIDAGKQELATQLGEPRGPANMASENCCLLIDTVGKSIAFYYPGTNDLAPLPSPTRLVSFTSKEAAKSTGPTHIRRVPNVALLKLKTLRMTLGVFYGLSFLGSIIARNYEIVDRTIKKEANQLSEATYTEERLDLCAKLDRMGNFGIAARGLELAVDLTVHPSTISKVETMEWFMANASI